MTGLIIAPSLETLPQTCYNTPNKKASARQIEIRQAPTRLSAIVVQRQLIVKYGPGSATGLQGAAMPEFQWFSEFWTNLQSDFPLLENVYFIFAIIVAIGTIFIAIYIAVSRICKAIGRTLSKRKKRNTPPKTKITAASLEFCPKTGPYYIAEHPHVVQTFTKDQEMPKYYEDLFAISVTWIYLNPDDVAEHKRRHPKPPQRAKPEPQPEPPKYDKKEDPQNPYFYTPLIYRILSEIENSPGPLLEKTIIQVFSETHPSEATKRHIQLSLDRNYIFPLQDLSHPELAFDLTEKGKRFLKLHSPVSPKSPQEESDALTLLILLYLAKYHPQSIILHPTSIGGDHSHTAFIEHVKKAIKEGLIQGGTNEREFTADAKITQKGLAWIDL